MALDSSRPGEILFTASTHSPHTPVISSSSHSCVFSCSREEEKIRHSSEEEHEEVLLPLRGAQKWSRSLLSPPLQVFSSLLCFLSLQCVGLLTCSDSSHLSSPPLWRRPIRCKQRTETSLAMNGGRTGSPPPLPIPALLCSVCRSL